MEPDDEEKVAAHHDAIAEAAERLGFDAEGYHVLVPVFDADEMAVDVSAIDLDQLPRFITNKVSSICYQQGEDGAMSMIRQVIGAAPLHPTR